MIIVAHKRSKQKNLINKYGDCTIVDVTSKAEGEIKKLSPFYPHGSIPIPNSNKFSESVEGLWQGLKIFEDHGIDFKSFDNRLGRNIKRTVRKYGVPKGHQYGLNSNELLSYIDARLKIYLPAYKFVLDKYCSHIINRLREASKSKTIILLDYTTNGDVYDVSTPLSHAQLVKSYTLDEYDSLYLSQKKARVEFEIDDNFSDGDILKIITDRTLSSREIIDLLKLNITPRKLTADLKKSNEIEIIKGNPLKFRKINTLKLF